MGAMWDFRDGVALSDAGIVGYDVEATDGRIGSIDESSADAGSAYIVVDTGFWIIGKQRLLPAGVIERVDDSARRVFVGLTKDQVKDAPDFKHDHRAQHEEYDNYYAPYGHADEVT